MSVLETKSLTVRYGGVTAVNSVDLTVGEGELVGLIGPNGAGKTSLIDAVTGYTACARRIVSIQASDSPMCRILPARTSAARAPMVSSIGVFGSTRCW